LTLDIGPDDSLAPVFWRAAGRLITGPLAFAIAGIVDLMIYSLHSMLTRVKQRW
jgi:hypothetical protein